MLPNNCADPVAACCEELFAVVDHFVTVAADAVQDCIGPQCAEFGRFVSHDAPVGPGDYVAGWISLLSPPRVTPGQKVLMSPKLVGNIVIRLVEGGFPMIDIVGGSIATPAFEKFNYAASHSYSHAEAALRAILNNLRAAMTRSCDGVQFINMRPHPPETGLIAWDFNLSASMRL